MENTRKWLTVDQAAEVAQVCSASILRWIKAGKIPASKIPAGYRIDSDTLEKFMEGKI